jgi:hypothetical protein
METHQAVIAVAVNLAMAGTLVGLVARGRARHCWSFVAYLCAVLTCDLLVLSSPRRYYTQEFWLVKQGMFDVLRTAVALEMTWRVVRSFPGAMRTARWMALAMLVGVTVVLASGPHRAGYNVMFEWQPRIVACTAMLFALTALLVAWYHLPVRAVHRSILGGFAIYSAFYATLLSLLQRWGWDFRVVSNAIGTLVFLGVTLWWLRTSWAREEEAMPAIDELTTGLAPAPQPQERAA